MAVTGLPVVITITPYVPDMTSDGVPILQALRQLEELGADVVGLNCGRGPHTMLPLLREARKVCKVSDDDSDGGDDDDDDDDDGDDDDDSDVMIGLNCGGVPHTMLPLVREAGRSAR